MKTVLTKGKFLLLASGLSISFAFAQLNSTVGNFQSLEKLPNGCKINTTNGQIKLDVYTPSIIRVQTSKDNTWTDFSYAVVGIADKNAVLNISETGSSISVSTDSILVVVSKTPVRLQFFNKKGKLLNEDESAFGTSWLGEEATTYKKIQRDEKFIGLGEKTGNLNRKGSTFVNWNTDHFAYPANADPLYQSIPFYMGIVNGEQYGIFLDNTHKTKFNFGVSNDRFASFSVPAGAMNYYFIYNSSVPKIIESYTWLTGRMQMPPLWSLGFQQCKYSYYPDEEVLSVANTFRAKQIPADVIYLDIHYMDSYKVFSWDAKRFVSPKTMTDKLKKIGFHTVVIIDPGIKKEAGYFAYDEGKKQDLFAKYPDGTFYTGDVWPGACHFPDFTNPKVREWWGKSFKSAYVDNGIEGFWNDMNEPATWGNAIPDMVEFDFEGRKGTHREAHNIYGLQMARSTFEGTKKLMNGQRPFILTRAGYSGIQRYSAVWTGDNVSTDEHMMSGVRLLSSMGLSGIPYVGMDIGGFTGNPTPSLFARWMSIGAFSPLFRAHVAIDQKDQEPWSFGKKVEAISRNYVNLHYKLIPYFYSLFYEAHKTGQPILRSLAYSYAQDDHIYDTKYQNQFFSGQGIMIAAVESYKENVKVYFPEGSWYDFYTDKTFAGKQESFTSSPIERLPVFIKGGSIVPMQTLVQNLSEKPADTLFVHVYEGKTGSVFNYYEDNGADYEYNNGDYYKRAIKYDVAKKQISLDKTEGKFVSKFKTVKFILHSFNTLSNGVKTGGKATKVAQESIYFMTPLPHFDPQGGDSFPEMIKVQSFSISNDNSNITINW